MNSITALDYINYERLVLNPKRYLPPGGPISLVTQCCTSITRRGQHACNDAIKNMPTHLAEQLLAEAIHQMEATSVSAIIASWPLETLCFREIMRPEQRNLFESEMGLDLMVFKGVTDRTRKCKMKFLDLRGLKLNFTFIKLIVQMWPMLSLRKKQRNVSVLTRTVLREAGLAKENKLAQEIIPKLIKDFLSYDVVLKRYTITMLRGDKLVVKIDTVPFSTQNTFFMDYLITNCLRKVTPLTVETSSLQIKSELKVGDEILDSLAPFIVFRGQNSQMLEGISVENLEDNVFFIIHQDISPFNLLTGLCLKNCNISLQEGRTRRRTQARSQFTTMLQGLSSLVRLDISQNSFAGCLPEILDALPQPLHYLNIRECDLNDSDIQYLADSRHATSLQYLNMSRICGLFPEDDFAVSTGVLVNSLRYFINVSVIHIQQNQITDTKADVLCNTIKDHWPRIKGLNVVDNILSSDSAISVVRACAGIKNMQQLKLPYAHNMLEGANLLTSGRQEFELKVKAELKSLGREDLDLEISNLAYAILANV